MADECDHSSSSIPRSDSKMVERKRPGCYNEEDERSESARKRVKMRDLESVFRSEAQGGSDYHHSGFSKCNENISLHLTGSEENSSQVTEEIVSVDLGLGEARMRKEIQHFSVDTNCRALDLNTKAHTENSLDNNDTIACVEDTNRQHDEHYNVKSEISVDKGLHVNAEVVSNSEINHPFFRYKFHDHFKARDVLECGSSTGPIEDKDPRTVWEEMKKNGFLSSSYGGIPMPKQHRRKSKNDMLKKKIEQAKQERVDKFTKIAAPSGLLNGLNPGIINHVRNSKQVHSIIEAIVKSGKTENQRVGTNEAYILKSGTTEIGDGKKVVQNTYASGTNQLHMSHEDEIKFLGSRQNAYNRLEDSGGYHELSMNRNMDCSKIYASHPILYSEDNVLALKSSATIMSNNLSHLSDEEPSSLAVKAATVASQWLQLLQQDIKGRLAALRRSKKRVRDVIHIELPFLISKEFPSNSENDPCITESSIFRCSKTATSDLHLEKWSKLFDQKEKALLEEEKQLEISLKKINDMQLHCEQGLQHIPHWNVGHVFQQRGEDCSRLGKADCLERDLAVRAAAASIYSTCNFLLSTENVSCFC
ncbi:hypothetical protein RJ641_005773 [Dillenia turbinata]|uniref:Uncharacterized protein n=1 Tax=Dillenia turbinata TaxID=194707 RepID=A0AAN8ZDE3_9MAGN